MNTNDKVHIKSNKFNKENNIKRKVGHIARTDMACNKSIYR